MEHGPFVDDLPIQHGDLHSYVKLPDSAGNDQACSSIATRDPLGSLDDRR